MIIVFFLCGCVPKKNSTNILELTPYNAMPTSTMKSEQATSTIAQTLPTPSPTPQYHTVQAGETMTSIAILYGVELNDLLVANPEINPNAMLAGMQVLIPPKKENNVVENTGIALAPVDLSTPTCIQEKSGGLWCFLMASNENEFALENVMIEITVGNESGAQLTTQIASAPLNLLPSKAKLPLCAYFPPPIPIPYRSSYTLKSAIPVEGESRYLTTEIREQTITISENSLSAQISARVGVNGNVGENVRIWLAAIAFDEKGNVIGVRRIETSAILPSDKELLMNGYVYSTGAPIHSVQLSAEALPIQ